jgi:hypothetical protein
MCFGLPVCLGIFFCHEDFTCQALEDGGCFHRIPPVPTCPDPTQNIPPITGKPRHSHMVYLRTIRRGVITFQNLRPDAHRMLAH